MGGLSRGVAALWLCLVACGGAPTGPGAPSTVGPQASTVQAAQAAADPAKPWPGTLLQDFTQGSYPLATWTSAAGATATLGPAGATRVAWTSAQPGQFTGLQVSGAWDLSRSDLLALDVGFDGATTRTRVAVYFCFDAEGFTNYAAATGLVSGVRKPPRFTIPIPRASLAVTGTANWSAVRRVEIRLHATDDAGTAGPTAMDLYRLQGEVVDRPRVVLSFDDGAASVHAAAFPITAALGIPATLYLNGQYVGHDGNLSLAQVQALYDAGWDVANHTIDHTPLAQGGSITRSGATAAFTTADAGDAHGLSPGDTVVIEGADQPEYDGAHLVASVRSATSFTFAVSGAPATPATGWVSFRTLPAATLAARIQAQTDWADAHGLVRGREHFAYPQGYFDVEGIALLQGLGFLTGRTVSDDPLPSYLWPIYGGLGSPFHLPACTLNAGTTAAEVLGHVDAAIATGASLHLYGHSLADPPANWADVSTPVFRAIAEGLAARRDAGRVDLLTISQWYAAAAGGTSPPVEAALAGLQVAPASVVGGAAATGTVSLTAPARAGGATVALSSGGPAVSVPASATVPAGSTSATFAIATQPVAAATAVSVTAAYGTAARTATLTVSPVVLSLPAPTGLKATGGTGQISLAWTAVPAAPGYRILRATSSGGPYAEVGSSATPAWIDAGLPDGVRRWYRVRAADGAAASASSSAASAWTTPAAPTGLSATAGHRSVTLRWTASTGATSYRVQRATAAAGPYAQVATTSGTSASNGGLTSGRAYFYRVLGVNAAGAGVPSIVVSATPR